MQIVYLVFLFGICFWGIKIKVNENYCDKKATNAIKGICIGLVFLSHSNGYLQFGSTIFDKIYNIPFRYIGQLMVVMFMFYSGYGIAVQYQKKGKKYLDGFVYKRIVKTEIHFIIGVVCFIILNCFIKSQYSLYNYIFSFIGWSNIGNSNWYIFDILVLYILSYISLLYSKKTNHIIISIWIATIVFWIFLYIFKGSDRWWYDSILAFPLGLSFAFFKDRIDPMISSNKYWIISFASSFFAFMLFYVIRHPISLSICSIFFAVMVVVITMRMALGNVVLEWMGTRLFEIYIFQRIPMIILDSIGIKAPVIFIGISIVVTALIAELMHRLYVLIDTKMDSLHIKKI